MLNLAQLNSKNMFVGFFLFFSLITPGALAQYDEAHETECESWFKSSKLVVGSKNCELSCASLKTGLDTFMCPNQCTNLCKADSHNPLLSKFIFYPGLTPAEKILIEKNPKAALVVFIQKIRAEKSTNRNFPDQGINDESDAFRHFVWAGLLTKELGVSKAKLFLDAHESDPVQPKKERQMDIHNNNRGQRAAEDLIQNKQWKIENLEQVGLKELRLKQLQVLKPSLPIPQEPK